MAAVITSPSRLAKMSPKQQYLNKVNKCYELAAKLSEITGRTYGISGAGLQSVGKTIELHVQAFTAAGLPAARRRVFVAPTLRDAMVEINKMILWCLNDRVNCKHQGVNEMPNRGVRQSERKSDEDGS